MPIDFTAVWMETCVRIGSLLYILRGHCSSHTNIQTCEMFLFSLKLMNFKKYYLKKRSYRLAVAPESKRFCRLTETRRFGEDGTRVKQQVALFDTRPLSCCFCLCLTRTFAYAASPASICAIPPSRQLKHPKSMSTSASGHPRMLPPPVGSAGDNSTAAEKNARACETDMRPPLLNFMLWISQSRILLQLSKKHPSCVWFW